MQIRSASSTRARYHYITKTPYHEHAVSGQVLTIVPKAGVTPNMQRPLRRSVCSTRKQTPGSAPWTILSSNASDHQGACGRPSLTRPMQIALLALCPPESHSRHGNSSFARSICHVRCQNSNAHPRVHKQCKISEPNAHTSSRCRIHLLRLPL